MRRVELDDVAKAAWFGVRLEGADPHAPRADYDNFGGKSLVLGLHAKIRAVARLWREVTPNHLLAV